MIFTRNSWTSEASDCNRYSVSWARITGGYCYQAFFGREVIASEYSSEPCHSEAGKDARRALYRACSQHTARSRQQVEA